MTDGRPRFTKVSIYEPGKIGTYENYSETRFVRTRLSTYTRL